MTRKLENLFDIIYENDSTKKPESFIEIIEPKLSFIDSFVPNNQNDYNKFTRIVSDYSLMLSQIGDIKKSRIYLEKSILLFENDRKLKGKNLFENSMYEALVSNRAVINFEKKNYKSAENDFINLTENFPNKKDYKDWLIKIRSHRFKTIEWGFLILIIIGTISSLYFKKNDGILNILSIIILVIGLIGSLTFRTFIKRRNIK
jgi:tetratricopeptide (TPR) repeat protein